MSVLEVKKLKKSFRSGLFSNKKEILSDINFSVSKTMTTGFLGANGSGKTTTLKCIFSLIPIDSGEVSFFNGQPLSRSTLKKIGFLPEQPWFYDYLTGEELLVFYGQLSADLKLADIKSRARSLLKKLDLYSAKDRQIKTYSKGMLQKIGIAQALVHNPEFVILDEPMAGLDPDSRLYVGELIQELVHQGVTVFFSSHLLYDVERLCQDLVVLKNGKVAYSGSVQTLLDRIKGRRQIIFLEKGQKHTIFTESLEDCQNKIDQLRKKSCVILDVQLDKKSLEQAFINITGEDL
ncbi:MAG: ABC transporter ATP-binding protein [Bdellovibrionales bacterium]|nr:ABC transporter ATP-binding protein [Bdellovibrionales bacterium]